MLLYNFTELKYYSDIVRGEDLSSDTTLPLNILLPSIVVL